MDAALDYGMPSINDPAATPSIRKWKATRSLLVFHLLIAHLETNVILKKGNIHQIGQALVNRN